MAALTAAALAADGPLPLPDDAPALDADQTVMVVGSSVSVRKYGVRPLPEWTGGPNRVPPQCTNGQNVFFRVFEMLNDHENMHWRRLPDPDWRRSDGSSTETIRVRGKTRTVQRNDWEATRDLPWSDAAPRIAFVAYRPDAFAEITVPTGIEKLDLIYCSDPHGDTIRVTIDSKPPAKNAVIDTRQDTAVPPKAKLGPTFTILDSHGKPRTVRPPKRGIRNIVELRARYALDPAREHTFRIRRGTDAVGKRILVWGVVYWRGNCVQVVQRAKGGINCGALPDYGAIQETAALRPDYVLMEAINIRNRPADVTRSLDAGFAWCAAHREQGRNRGHDRNVPASGLRFKTLVYATPQASSAAFRAWFRDPKHKPPYGARDYQAACADDHAAACHAAVVALCEKYGFPLVDVGATVDAWLAEHKTARFVPHILKDWYHPNHYGAALFGKTIHDGIRRHWPELPVRPIRMPEPPQ
jgi:hypothetical protein